MLPKHTSSLEIKNFEVKEFRWYLFIYIFLQSTVVILFLSFQIEVEVDVIPHVMVMFNMLLEGLQVCGNFRSASFKNTR